VNPSDRKLIVLDPFSREARELAKKTPPLDALGQRYIQACRERIEWFASPFLEKDGIPVQIERSPPDVLIEPPDLQFDISVFYLLMQSCAACFPPGSFEARTVISANREIFRRRLKACYAETQEAILDLLPDIGVAKAGPDEIPRQDLYKIMALRKFAEMRSASVTSSTLHEIKFKANWTRILPTTYDLTDFYIKDGWAYLSANDLLELLSQDIGRRMELYMSQVRQKMDAAKVKPHPTFRSVGKIISDLSSKSHEDLVGMGGELREEFYPPCIKQAEQGVDAGSRNYAVTVLLTSFLSHARISPFAGDAKISDFIDDMSVITSEILPRIYEAGARCNPPLFDDQPVEKANIMYHLGFGLIENPRLEDSGNSTWYIPPNCEKIQREVPMLCKPDALCRRIKNPIIYYVIKARGSERPRESTSSLAGIAQARDRRS